MRVKVICAVLVYNGHVYREGDYVKVENEEDKQIMIQERSAIEAPIKIKEQPDSRIKRERRQK